MSTEHQRFSPDNQKAVNTAYAALHGFEIVATYQDSGKSGLTLKGRPELKRLLADVLSGDIEFRAILVLDVSRWGRFQDADQSAHYEYMCREAGVPVRYCSEAFANDGSAMASIVKHLKRVMAAEYSRELSVRISRAQRQQAGLGFKQGGAPVHGIRRQVVDEAGKPRMLLSAGERKALTTDKVLFVRGPRSEVALIQRIYRMYVRDKLRISEITDWLFQKGKVHSNDRPWTYASVRHVLRNEIYVGTYVFGRIYNNLGDLRLRPDHELIRCEVIRPIVSVELFAAASERLDQTTRRAFSDDAITNGLARLLAEKGRISTSLIQEYADLPTPDAIRRRFGSLEIACRLIGHDKPRRCRLGGPNRRYSDEDLLVELRRIFAANGYLSRKIIDQDPSSPKGTYFTRRLGGLLNAYFRAGLPITPEAYARHRRNDGDAVGIVRTVRPRKNPAHRSADGSRMTDTDLLESLKLLFANKGYLSALLIDSDLSLPSSTYYRRRLGGLARAYAAVGYCTSRSEIVGAAFARRRFATTPSN